VSGTGVDDPTLSVGESNRLNCRRIGQAKDRDIGFGEQACARVRIFALGGINLFDLDVVTFSQALGNLQPGGAGLSVDEYPCELGGHGSSTAGFK
jgi:hypothetical protein